MNLGKKKKKKKKGNESKRWKERKKKTKKFQNYLELFPIESQREEVLEEVGLPIHPQQWDFPSIFAGVMEDMMEIETDSLFRFVCLKEGDSK